MSDPGSLTRLARPAAVVGAVALGAAVLALGTTVPAHADEVFPATAGSTLVSLTHDGGDTATAGSWGRIYVGSDVGDDYPSADFSADPGGVSALLGIGGPVESLVNTTATGDGRAEAASAISGGFTLDLPGYDEPAVRFSTLDNTLRCDFSGDVVWENRIGSSGENDRVITVFGTPVTADAPEVNATVDVPGRDTTADVTVQTREPDGASGGRGEVSTVVRASEDGAALFELTLGALAVDCSGAGAGPPGTGDGETGDAGRDDDAAERDDLDDGDGARAAEPGDDSDSGDSAGGGGGTEDADGDQSDGGASDDGSRTTGADEPAAAESPVADGARDAVESGPAGLPLTGGALAGLVTAGILALGGGGAALYLARRGKHGDGSGDDGSGEPQDTPARGPGL
ncbi:hypothetical protein ACFWTE_23140 [Nocardiopsis sp. NPDC058631]|uniref:hypothetical protein n=1 Tax=Nocardiopsis sp. NPDC058631 TaxID=3346566 RepID=UPI003661C0F5